MEKGCNHELNGKSEKNFQINHGENRIELNPTNKNKEKERERKNRLNK